jgi:ASC-1-like (ASCH) protein
MRGGSSMKTAPNKQEPLAMKKILFPIAVASALSVVALNTLPGQAQEEKTQGGSQVEEKQQATKQSDEKAAGDAQKAPEKAAEPAKSGEATSPTGGARAFPTHAVLDLITDEEVKEFAAKWFPAAVADRLMKLVSRARELNKLFDEKVKELDAAAAEPGVGDQQIRDLASRVALLKRGKQNLHDAFHQFFFQPDPIGDAKTSLATRIARVTDLSAAIEGAEVRLGLRPAPAAPRVGSQGSFNRGGGGPRSGGNSGPSGFNFPGAPTRVDLLKTTMSDDEVKTYLQERFPAAAMERISKLIMRARELAKSFDEKIAKIDADLADEKLSDDQIEAMVGIARMYRSTKESLAREFDNISMSNLSMQTMSEAVSWLPQLARAVKQAEANIQSIDNHSTSARSGIRASEFAEMYQQTKSLYADFAKRLPEVQAQVKDQNLSAQQRKVIEGEVNSLEQTLRKMIQAIREYEAMQTATDAISSERFVNAAKMMREALKASENPLTSANDKTSPPADPKEAHAKLYQLAKSLLEQIDSKLKTIGVQVADPKIASDELDRLAQHASELRVRANTLTQSINGYQNSIQNRPDPDQSMVVDNVVEMQRAIRDAEAALGTKVTLSVSTNATYAEVLNAVEENAGSTVRIEITSDHGPLVKRLISACGSLKNQLESRMKEVDEKLKSPDISLEEVSSLAKFRSEIERAIEYCGSNLEFLQGNKSQKSRDHGFIADKLQEFAREIIQPQLGAGGPIIEPKGSPMGGPLGMSPTGGGPAASSGRPVPRRGSSSGMPMMQGGPSMPGMPVYTPQGYQGMMGMPGMGRVSQFHEVEELRTLYKKHFDEKNEKAAAEVKDKIAKELARIFDAQQAAREKQLTAAKERLEKLEAQQGKRKAAKEELIESRTKQIIQELEGTAWTDDETIDELGR